MDASLVNAASNATSGNAIPNLVLRKAMDIQAQSALSLLEALPAPPGPASVNPAHLGQNIDVRA
ncbi:YjfB family protein [Chitinilyticum litopenaei]|uniref:YjfB family protein n=1 Tax=Chitinilyticum litopenaei TaxID=1121276 RepID=UPI00040BE85A|nr:YjfB family protein [Chitinilyticum litopenaei]